MLEQKQKNPKMKWKNVPFIITTNALPPVLVPPTKGNNENQTQFENRLLDHGAMMSRCKLTHLKIPHSNSDVFPYTSDELAIYMKHLCL